MDVIGIRGAVRAERNGREEILAATRWLLREIERHNGLERSDLVSAFFTMTPDLDAVFPATAARELGWSDVPMLGSQETSVPGAPDRMIRVLLHARSVAPPRHVYLGEAAALRPDLPPPAPARPPGGTLLVVGLGLIGGSIALAVRRGRAFRRVLGSDLDASAVEAALRRGAIDAGGTDLWALVPEADIILLAVPVLAAARWLCEHGAELPASRALVDVSSTTRVILEAMERLPPGVEAIGAHPIGGSERSGMDAARPDLLRGAVWALVRGPRTGARAEAAAHALVEATGGKAIGVDAARHDAAVAATSHLPYLLSVALALHVDGDGDAVVRRSLAGPGLRDATRLAAARPAVMADILQTNWGNVKEETRRYQRRLETLLIELERGLPGSVSDVLERAVRAHASLFPQTGSSRESRAPRL